MLCERYLCFPVSRQRSYRMVTIDGGASQQPRKQDQSYGYRLSFVNKMEQDIGKANNCSGPNTDIPSHREQ